MEWQRFPHSPSLKLLTIKVNKIVTLLVSVGIDPKELGGQMSKCLEFCPEIEI